MSIKISSFDPILVNEFISTETLDKIYELFNAIPAGSNKKMETGNPANAYYFLDNADLKNAFAAKMLEVTGHEFETSIPLFVRYAKVPGGYPMCQPHCDTASDEEHGLTISVQLKSNTDWEVCVENMCVQLKEQDAFLFCGSNDIHWRPAKAFADEDFVDILVCHFFIKDKTLTEHLPAGHRQDWENRAEAFKANNAERVFGDIEYGHN